MEWRIRFFIVISSFFFIHAIVCGQDFLGFANSIYAGVNGIDVNPALIVNNPRKWDVTPVGFNFSFGNNFVGLQHRVLQHTGSLFTGDYPAFHDEKFTDHYLTRREGRKSVSVFLNADVVLPSFMFIRSKQKDAFAFTSRVRSYLNVDGIDPLLAHMFLTGATDSLLFGQNLPTVKMNLQAMLWAEYGITYGKTIFQTSGKRLSIAGRVKFLQGMNAFYLFLDNVNYKFYKSDSLAVMSAQINYGHSTNFELSKDAFRFNFAGKPMLALDVGVTYEFKSATSKAAPVTSFDIAPRLHEYRYKIGISLQDLGWITFLKPTNARDFNTSFNENLDLKSFETKGGSPLASIDETLRRTFQMNGNDTKFSMNLPTVLSLQGDAYLGKNIYVNSTINYAFQLKNNANKIHEVTVLSITPRWDWKWLGFYLPVSYNKYSKFRLGLSMRIGPLVVGTADIFPFISKRDIYGVDVHFLLKVPHLPIEIKKHNGKPRFLLWKKKSKKQEKGDSYMPSKDTSPIEDKNNKSGK